LERLRVPKEVAEILREFVEKVRRVLGEDTEVYLFGSYARGDWLRDGDLDLIVVSPRFEGMDLGKRYTLVRELLPTNISADLLLYTAGIRESTQQEHRAPRCLRILDKVAMMMSSKAYHDSLCGVHTAHLASLRHWDASTIRFSLWTLRIYIAERIVQTDF